MRGRVFVLGAGASHDDTLSAKYPLPLATGFFEDKYTRAFWQGGPTKFRKSSLGRVLRHYYGVRPQSDTPVNVEDVYSFLDLAPSLVGRHLDDKQAFFEAKTELQQYITRVICETSILPKDARFYPWLAQTLTEDDSVITFNWDTLLDQALSATSTPHPLLARWRSLLAPTFPPADEALDVIEMYEASPPASWRRQSHQASWLRESYEVYGFIVSAAFLSVSSKTCCEP